MVNMLPCLSPRGATDRQGPNDQPPGAANWVPFLGPQEDALASCCGFLPNRGDHLGNEALSELHFVLAPGSAQLAYADAESDDEGADAVQPEEAPELLNSQQPKQNSRSRAGSAPPRQSCATRRHPLPGQSRYRTPRVSGTYAGRRCRSSKR